MCGWSACACLLTGYVHANQLHASAIAYCLSLIKSPAFLTKSPSAPAHYHLLRAFRNYRCGCGRIITQACGRLSSAVTSHFSIGVGILRTTILRPDPASIKQIQPLRLNSRPRPPHRDHPSAHHFIRALPVRRQSNPTPQTPSFCVGLASATSSPCFLIYTVLILRIIRRSVSSFFLSHRPCVEPIFLPPSFLFARDSSTSDEPMNLSAIHTGIVAGPHVW